MASNTELVIGEKYFMTAKHVRFLSWNSRATAASQRTCRSTVQSGSVANPSPVVGRRRLVALVVVRAVTSRSPSVTTTSGPKSLRSTVARQIRVVGRTSCRSRSRSPSDAARASPSPTWYSHSTRRGGTAQQNSVTDCCKMYDICLASLLFTCLVTWDRRHDNEAQDSYDQYNRQHVLVPECLATGPPTHSVGGSIVLLFGVCCHLSSVVVCNT